MSRAKTWYYAQPKAIRVLLSINVAAYLIWQIGLIHFEPTAMFVYRHVALNPTLPGILYEPWQLITYSFLHLSPGFGGLLHILFNMLWMIWIGREYEQMQGAHRMFALYILGGVGGSLLTVVLHALFPEVGPFGGIVHGASGSVLGIMTAIGVQYPQKTIALLFIGVVRLIHVVIGFLFLDILFLAGGGTSVSAHLGGVLAGFVWARAALADIDLSGWAKWFFPPRYEKKREGLLHRLEALFEQRKHHDTSSSVVKNGTQHNTRNDVGSTERVEEQDVDTILDKISEFGYDALSEKEKKTLYEASNED